MMEDELLDEHHDDLVKELRRSIRHSHKRLNRVWLALVAVVVWCGNHLI